MRPVTIRAMSIPKALTKTIDEMESRWYDATHRQTEADKMVEDYNNGLTVPQ